MCDQTEVTYLPDEVVWVKLGSVWWPGQVQDYDKLDEEITSNFKKKPIAVVKFFQEDSFEYVKNLNHIYGYNCQKKEEFIKKGLDLVRSSNSRDVPSNMKMFPNDVVTAEHLTGGNPNILNETKYAPEQKSNYTDLFGSKKLPGKKGKSDCKKEDILSARKSLNINHTKSRKSLPTLPATVPRPITHPRFIVKALKGQSDHEVRIRCQLTSPKDDEVTQKTYTCHLCGYQATRVNVIIMHNKSHSAGFADAYKIKPGTIKTAKNKDREQALDEQNSFSDKTPTVTTSRGRVKVLPKKLLDYSDEPPPKMLKDKSPMKSSIEKNPEISKQTTEKTSTKKSKDSSEKLTSKRPLFGKRKSAKEKAELAAKQKQDNEAMKETLLKDWDDDDLNQEEVELERLKQALESTSSEISIDNSMSLNNKNVVEESDDKSTEKIIEASNVKATEVKKHIKNDDKAEIFDFDDSEDSFPVTINFRNKNQREPKFTDDKFKKPKPPKPLAKLTPKNRTTTNLPSALPLQVGNVKEDLEGTEKKNEDVDTEEFNNAFNALLQETSVPNIPELPKALCDQTSDITSTTDLMSAPGGEDNAHEDQNFEVMEISQSCDSDNIKVESSSAGNEIKPDFEDMNTVKESSSNNDSKEVNCLDAKKIFNDFSATDSRAEIDSKVISSGVSSVAEESGTFEANSVDNSSQVCEPAIEITSSCDSFKSSEHSFEATDLANEKTHQGLSEDKKSIDSPDKSMLESHNVRVDETYLDDKQIIDVSEVGYSLRDPGSGNKDADFIFPLVKDGEKESFNDLKKPVEEKCVEKSKEESNVVSETNFNPDHTNLVKPENIDVSEINSSLIIEEQPKINKKEDCSFYETVSSDQNNLNPQLLTLRSEVTTVQVVCHQQPSSDTVRKFVQKPELTQSTVPIQNIGQSLQDMELDINSMPVIIGGEDFMQPDDAKTIINDPPKYSESIVVGPKTTNQVQSPNKPEGLIMKIEMPPSNQNIQSVINIPSKTMREGVKGGRIQKSSSKTIKLSASALKNLGNLNKGGQPVLILKTASGQEKSDGSPDKNKAAVNVVQHGNEFLIVNNTPMSGQTAIKINTQQLLAGGKLSPGTGVFTSKVASSTSSTPSSSNLNKITVPHSPSKQTKKVVFSQAGILATTSKSVLINNSSGKLVTVPSTQTIATSKGKNLVTHNIISSKGSLILPNPSQNTSTNLKTTTALTSHTLTSGQGTMILAPIASKGGTVLAGNQKLRLVTSKAPVSGTRYVVQNSPGKITLDPLNKNQQIKLVSGLKGPQQGNTFLIKTSQRVFTKPLTTSTVTLSNKAASGRASTSKTILTTIPTQAKISGVLTKPIQSQVVQQSKIIHQPQIMQSQASTSTQQIILSPPAIQTQFGTQDQVGKKSTAVKRLGVPKSRQSANNTPKSTRKTAPRTPKPKGNRFISPAIKDSVMAPSNLPVIGHGTMVQGQISQNPDVLYVTLDESGNYRPLDNKTLVTLQRPSEVPSSLFIPTNNQPQEVGNIFIAIDESGNFINLTRPTANVSVSSQSTSGQDILAKALENTQVFQQETIIPDIDVSEALSSSVESNTLASSFSDHSQYTPTVAPNVLETSLTLNQPPIMTPLEVPSVVSPNLGSMSALSTNFIASELLSTKHKPLSPSMPLLSEETISNKNNSDQVFLLDSSNNMIPAGSGSQLSFQLALNDRNMIVSSDSGSAPAATSFEVVSGHMIQTESDMSNELGNMHNIVQEECIIEQDDLKLEPIEHVTLNSHEEKNQESLEAPQVADNQNSIIQEALDTPHDHNQLGNVTTDITTFIHDNEIKSETVKEEVKERENAYTSDNSAHALSGELSVLEQHKEGNRYSRKRGLEEERTVSSSSDLEDDSKRMKIEER